MSNRSDTATIPLCPLIARETELHTLVRLWQSSRLVTLYGQSGAGKSALARAAAAEIADQKPNRVLCLDAGGARGGAAVLRLLARVRRRTESVQPILRARTLENQVRPAAESGPETRPSFILLDHLSMAVQEATRGLLQWLVAHPDVHLLVAARRPLELLGEQVLPLLPLTVTALAPVSSPASELFQHYARRAQPNGPPAEPATVAAVCQALDGLPAALEAAASLMGALPEREIVRIAREEPFSLALRGTSLRGMLAATWSDLPSEARDYLADLFAEPAAWDSNGGPPIPKQPAAQIAALLIQLGLLQIAETCPQTRYRLSRLMQVWLAQTSADSFVDGQECPGSHQASGPLASLTSGQAPAPRHGSGNTESAARVGGGEGEKPLLIRLLGPMGVEGPRGKLPAARLRPKEQRILARLALELGQVIPRDELLDLFWPDSGVGAAERSLRTMVSSLRGALRSVLEGETPRLISGRLDGYCLEAGACAVDAAMFAQAVRVARAAPPNSPSALAAWRQTVELYRGELLGAFLYEDWCLSARERLRNDFLDALFQLARATLAMGFPDEACDLAVRMVEIDAAEERAHRLLMRCYALLGRPAAALRQFERCRAALWDELGARPAAATLSLLQSIRAGAAFVEDEEPAPLSTFDEAALL